MSEEDRIDEIIRSAASDYNRPGETPRDEMWAAIQAARSAPGPRLHVTSGGAPSGYNTPKKFGAQYAWIGMAAAAAILIASGVMIGRWSNRQVASTVREKPVGVYAENPGNNPVPEGEVGSQQKQQAPDTEEQSQPQAAPRTREQIRQNPIINGQGSLKRLDGTRVASNTTAPLNPNVYQVATVRHLADAELLLTAFARGSRDASMNAQFADWAKGLLSNTRLLLDSPAGDDPRRAKLLQDLELVLAQIVQLEPNARAEERQLIEGSIEQGHVMTRLRTAIPAGDARILEKQ